MSRKSKLLRSDEEISNCLFELDSNDEESDLLELDVMYDSENDKEYNPDESEEGGDDCGSDSSESSDFERPIKKRRLLFDHAEDVILHVLHQPPLS